MIYNKLEPYYFDNKFNKKYVEPYLYIFKNIHPNTITISGIFFNCIAIYSYYIIKNNHITAILLLLRIFVDNLDGMVARKFNKTSKFGGLLDGLADCFMMGTLWYGFFNKIGLRNDLSLCLSIDAGCVMFGYLIYNDAVIVHSNFTRNDTFLNIIPFLIYNNTYLSILFVILLIYLF
jgi:phosphatidylglycerophosphate synthase